MARPPERLASEDVIINAPLSYTGSLQRISRSRRLVTRQHVAVRILFDVLVIIPSVLFAWSFITFWYIFFGLWLLPYRLLRRGSRKRKKQSLQHREMLNAVSQVHEATLATAVSTAISAGLIQPPEGPPQLQIEPSNAPAIQAETTTAPKSTTREGTVSP